MSATTRDGKSNTIGRLKLVTPDGPLTRGTDGLFRAADGRLAADTTAQVQTAPSKDRTSAPSRPWSR